MASKDRLSFRQLAESEDIHRYMQSRGFTPFLSPTAISKEVNEFADEIKESIRKELEEVLRKGDRLSTTTDEWTSLKICRYCCVNVHAPDGDYWPIGMVRVRGKFTAEACAALLTKKLEDFGLDAKTDLVSGSTDGASVMKKAGRVLPFLHFLCQNHGIHLAVLEVLYEASIEFDLAHIPHMDLAKVSLI